MATQSTFELDIMKFKDKLNGRIDQTLRRTALEIDKGVVFSTPVDTGQARGGWNVGINNVNLQETGKDKSGNKTHGKNSQVISTAKAGDTIFISNNVGHITELEKGSSSQSPNGMVAKTLRQFPQIVRESVIESKRENP